MRVFSRHAPMPALLACAFSLALFNGLTPPLQAHEREERRRGSEAAPAMQAPQSKPVARPVDPSTAQKGRLQREQAYAKLLEGQRYLTGARSGSLSVETVRQAQRAFQQASELDPTLAEAHTALAEIAFFFLNNLDEAEREAATATRIDRDNFGAHRVLSRVYSLRSGLFDNSLDRSLADRAIAELREIVRLDSNDAEAWALLGELYQATGRDRESIEAFTNWAASPPAAEGRFFQNLTRGRELTPESAAARLGEALLRAGRTSEAVTAIRRAMSLDPENMSYLELLGRAFEAGGDDQTIISELRRVVVENPSNAAAASLLARTQARAGLVDDAVATLRAATATRDGGDRERLTLQAELAQILADALRYEESIAIYEELLKARGIGSAPLTSESEKRLAGLILERIVGLRRQAGQTSEALATIERMRRLLGSNDPAADLQYILLLQRQGKRQEALEAVRAARLKHPDQVEFVRLEADALANLGRVEEGATLLRGRLKGGPEDYNEYLAIASLYLEAGRGTEAVEAARKALELAPSNRQEFVTQALLMLSSAQDRAGDAKGSEESLRRILSKEPNNATALNNLGYFLVERNERLPEALEMIKRAVRAEPTNASFLDSLGWAYYKLGQLEEAERYLSNAARRNPTSVTIQEHLGDLYHRRGKTDLARTAWQKALSLSVEAADAARIKAKLDGEISK